jgi:hypothetical protein
MGHLDVVPVEAGTESRWKQPPFTGVVADSYVWGRDTLDDKVAAGLMPGVSRQVALIGVVEKGSIGTTASNEPAAIRRCRPSTRRLGS